LLFLSDAYIRACKYVSKDDLFATVPFALGMPGAHAQHQVRTLVEQQKETTKGNTVRPNRTRRWKVGSRSHLHHLPFLLSGPRALSLLGITERAFNHDQTGLQTSIQPKLGKCHRLVCHVVLWSGQTELSRLVVNGVKLEQVGLRLLGITERAFNDDQTWLQTSIRPKLGSVTDLFVMLCCGADRPNRVDWW
jgi:hypothetical protein